jgi:hypothetical protein
MEKYVPVVFFLSNVFQNNQLSCRAVMKFRAIEMSMILLNTELTLNLAPFLGKNNMPVQYLKEKLVVFFVILKNLQKIRQAQVEDFGYSRGSNIEFLSFCFI